MCVAMNVAMYVSMYVCMYMHIRVDCMSQLEYLVCKSE